MAYRYQGNSNHELVETLEKDGIIQTGKTKRALLALPRGDFIPSLHRDQAYIDRPIRLEEYGFNVSAPHMYALCLDHLDICAGNSFLDVGTGCGFMAGLACYLTGRRGRVLGVDILDSSLELSNQNKENMERRGVDTSCLTYEKRNIFLPDPDERRWDRIHVGAACPQKLKHKLYELLNPGGILIMPLGTNMIEVRKDLSGFTTESKLLDVRYGDLVVPSQFEIDQALKMMSLRIVLPQSSINQDYIKMYNNQFLSDVTFSVGDNCFFAHKAILASRCEYFASLYSSGMQEAMSNKIVVTNYSVEGISNFLKFIYTDSCQVSSPQLAAELMSIAEYYRLERLKALMELMLSKLIDIDSSCAILEIAHIHHAAQLKRLAFEFILCNYDDISKTKGYADMNKDCIKEILEVAISRIPINLRSL